jgi:hypothetical protein
MRRLFVALLTVLAVQNLAAEPKLPLGQFSRNQLDGWEHKSFKGETRSDLHLVIFKFTGLVKVL